jgi:hypothetical protein
MISSFICLRLPISWFWLAKITFTDAQLTLKPMKISSGSKFKRKSIAGIQQRTWLYAFVTSYIIFANPDSIVARFFDHL